MKNTIIYSLSPQNIFNFLGMLLLFFSSTQCGVELSEGDTKLNGMKLIESPCTEEKCDQYNGSRTLSNSSASSDFVDGVDLKHGNQGSGEFHERVLGDDRCGHDEAQQEWWGAHPESLKEKEEFEQFTRQFVKEMRSNIRSSRGTYVIPVVFHVFGTDFDGYTVDTPLIKKALEYTNKELNGLNPDFDDVHSQFESIRGTLDIEFRLAQKDPNGNLTSGVTYNPYEWGFANTDSTTEEIIQSYAWDNYKYMNVYIMLETKIQGTYNKSGTTWLPDTSMSDDNLARVVFNGKYVGDNAYALDMRRLLTHEFGHFLNLEHTFENGCDSPGDFVDDTPYTVVQYDCPFEEFCDGAGMANEENFMSYSSCPRMFTQGQVDRMIAALNHPARYPLWQASNHAEVFDDDQDTEPPSVPTGLTATNVTTTSITLSWDPSTDNVAVKNYMVFKNNIGDEHVTDPRITYTGLTPDTEYKFEVKAVDISGNKSASCPKIIVKTNGMVDTDNDSQGDPNSDTTSVDSDESTATDESTTGDPDDEPTVYSCSVNSIGSSPHKPSLLAWLVHTAIFAMGR